MTGEGRYLCPVCEEEYYTGDSCDNCGNTVSHNDYSCPHCGHVPKEGDGDHIFAQCYYCDDLLEWNPEDNEYSCQDCEMVYKIGRACPICVTNLPFKTSKCQNCGRVLQKNEGEFIYLFCPIHRIQNEFTDGEGYYCISCLADSDDNDVENVRDESENEGEDEYEEEEDWDEEDEEYYDDEVR
jgi:hypothetical protein